MMRRGPPQGVFSKVLILQGSKSSVLKVRIPKKLKASFSKVRILKELVICDRRVVSGRRDAGDGRGEKLLR